MVQLTQGSSYRIVVTFCLLTSAAAGASKNFPKASLRNLKCIHKGACKNLATGHTGGQANQDRPVLSGKQDYRHVNSDGTCKYGHAGATEECKAGWYCGYTFFDCVCVSEERQVQGKNKEVTIKMMVGIGCLVAGVALAALSVYTVLHVRGQLAAHKSATVCPDPYGKVSPVKATGIAQGAAFSNLFGPPPHIQTEARTVSTDFASRTNASQTNVAGPPTPDCCGMFCLVLPVMVIIFGLIVVLMALAEHKEPTYFNECASAA